MRATMRYLPLAALLLATACAHGGPRAGAAAEAAPVDRAAAPADYFPLAVGNAWVWEDQSPGRPAGQAAASRTVRILERTADGFFRDSERGELRSGVDCVRDRVRQLLCGPLQVGTSWKSVVSVSSTEKYEISGVDEVVTTPAGTFRGCVKVRGVNHAGAGTDLVNEISYAPGVGPVRIETFAVVNGAVSPQFRAVLRGYRVGGT
jgi:hypothetical protein